MKRLTILFALTAAVFYLAAFAGHSAAWAPAVIWTGAAIASGNETNKKDGPKCWWRNKKAQ